MFTRVFLVAALAAALPVSVFAQPAISFEGQAVVARGLSPGGQAVLFGIAREPQGFFTRVVRRQEVVTAGSSGEARLDLGRTVPERSVWFAADLSSGAYRVSLPSGSPAKEIALPGNALEAGAPGRGGRMRSGLGFIEVLYVRPARGAWGLSVGDGGESDADGTSDLSAAAALDRLVPVGAGPGPPTEFLAGDIVVVVDPRGLEYFAARLVSGGPVR